VFFLGTWYGLVCLNFSVVIKKNVGGHWPLWRDGETEWPRRTDKSWTL